MLTTNPSSFDTYWTKEAKKLAQRFIDTLSEHQKVTLESLILENRDIAKDFVMDLGHSPAVVWFLFSTEKVWGEIVP